MPADFSCFAKITRCRKLDSLFGNRNAHRIPKDRQIPQMRLNSALGIVARFVFLVWNTKGLRKGKIETQAMGEYSTFAFKDDVTVSETSWHRQVNESAFPAHIIPSTLQNLVHRGQVDPQGNALVTAVALKAVRLQQRHSRFASLTRA